MKIFKILKLKYWLFIVFIVSAAYLWWTPNLLTHATPYYIAVSGPMSGNYASDGQAMAQAIRLHLDQLNAQGGVNGHLVQLLVYDDQNKTELAAKNATEIANNSKALAVIGHYTSNASLAAAPIYKANQLPAITGTATTDSLTQDNDWYFRVIFNNQDQATLIANYIYKVLNHHQASIISTDTTFGRSLAQNFNQTAENIGLNITQHWTFKQGDANSFDDALDQLLTHYKNIEKPPALFIATHSSQAVTLVTALRRLGKKIPVIGADSLASTSFRNRLNELPQERAKPGYYTDNLLAAMPFLPDIAGQRAQDFYYAFTEAYGEEPSSAASMYYDAALTITQALKSIDSKQNLHKQRQQIQQALWQISDHKSGVEGVSGLIHFDRNGDAIKGIPMGVFKNGRPIAAQEQFQPITDLSNSSKLLEEALNHQVVNINGKFMRRSQVVYVGLDFNEITELSAADSQYSADFYLWFRFQSHNEEQMQLFFNSFESTAQNNVLEPVQTLDFLNSVDPMNIVMEPVLVHHSTQESGAITRAYRIKTHFKIEFDFSSYPLDKQTLQIKFRHKKLTRDRLIFVVDTLGMNLGGTDNQTMLRKFTRNNVLNIGGWQLERTSFYQSSRITDSTLGVPELFGTEQRIEYSQFNAELEIVRDFLSFVLKNLLPVIFVVILGYFVFFIPTAGPGFAVRITLSVNMILSTSLFHIRMASNMPEIDYLILMEYAFYMVYLLAVFNMLISVIKQLKSAGTSESDKLCAIRTDQFGRIFYPLFILIALIILYSIYA